MTPAILLVEDNPSDANLVRAALADVGADIICVESLADALIELDTRVVGCVVLDLGPPEAENLGLVDALVAAHPGVPIVALTSRVDAARAVEAVHRGAQDYLLKSELDSRTMGRAVTYAIERAASGAVRAQSAAHYHSVIDSLGEGVVVMSASGRVDTANAEAARILGLTVDEFFVPVMTGFRWSAVDERDRPLPPEMLPAFAALRTGEPVVDFMMGIDPPAGGRRWLEVNAFPMSKAPDTPPYAVVVSMRDVTAKRAAIKQTQFQADLLDAVGQAIIATDAVGTITYWNHAAVQQCGWSADEALGRNLFELTAAPEMAERLEPIITELIAGRSWTGDVEVLRRDGTTFPALVTDTPFFDADGQFAGVIGVATDITERDRAEETMRRLSAIVESSADAIMGHTLDGIITSWNRGAENLYGYGADEVVGQHVAMLMPAVPLDEQADVLRRVAFGETVQHIDFNGRRKDGGIVDVSAAVSPVYGKDGAVVGCAAIVRDVSARAEAQRALKHQALHDTLTGLPNRTLLDDRIDLALARARRHDERVAVLLLDLDEFKLVNDGLGHLAGDELLVEVAHRLAKCVRPDDTVARFGGDEFVIVAEVATAEVATQVGARVLSALQAPFSVQGTDIFVTTSIGLVIADGDADSDGLLRDADAAMYRAKERGRSRMEVFDDELRDRAASKLQSTTALRRALEREELRVFYQPIVSIDDRRPLAVEALLRWQHPERGLVSPAEFITLAEDTGMIVPMGRWVLQEALRQRACWEADLPDRPPLRLSVNLSARQLSEPKLADDIAAALSTHRTDPSSLILEVTESVVMGGLDSLTTLNAIHDLGVALHVDDFGTGYSSLAYLKTLPVDALKIDRAFVDGLGTDVDDLAIVTAVIALARALSLGLVAEGVETEDQLSGLRELHCEHAQGYLFARPMPYDELVAWLATQA
jgi:diguanylate cyclase (GGDEF)-like protein/PAS domain S-box-containing protein